MNKLETITSVGDYLNRVKGLFLSQSSDDNTFKPMFFRGQAKEGWSYIPSLFREQIIFENERNLIIEVERQLPEAFLELTLPQKIAKMQHFGVPTRMLDGTTNPLVALYFACEGEEYIQEDGEVIVANIPEEVEGQNRELNIVLDGVINAENKRAKEATDRARKGRLRGVVGIRPIEDNERIRNQAGRFALFLHMGEFDRINDAEKALAIVDRIRIPSEYKRRMQAELSTCGFGYSFIYPEMGNKVSEIVNSIIHNSGR